MEAQEAELTNGIFNFLISLIQLKSQRLGQEAAKAEVIEMLQSYITGLQKENSTI